MSEHDKVGPSLRRPTLTHIAPSHIWTSIAINIACPYMFSAILASRTSEPWHIALLILIFPLAALSFNIARMRIIDPIASTALLFLLCNLATQVLHIFVAISPAVDMILRFALPLLLPGILILLSQNQQRPALFYGDRFWHAGASQEAYKRYDLHWQEHNDYQLMIRHVNRIWGIVYLILAMIMAANALLLPQSYAQPLALLILVGSTIMLLLWTEQQQKPGADDSLEKESEETV